MTEYIICKICSAKASRFFTCDFHNNTRIHHGLWCSPVNLCGKMVDYFKCQWCGFLFTSLMDDWTNDEFVKRVYNKDYVHLDGDYQGSRSTRVANVFWCAFYKDISNLSFLDYGGGLGVQSDMLKRLGAKYAVSYDPFVHTQKPEGKFDVVSCGEVLEHTTDPHKTCDDLMNLVKDDGLIFCTTEIVPHDIEIQKDKWWYVSPRTGHISFYTKECLSLLYKDMNVVHVGSGIHIVYRKWPKWAETLLPNTEIEA